LPIDIVSLTIDYIPLSIYIIGGSCVGVSSISSVCIGVSVGVDRICWGL